MMNTYKTKRIERLLCIAVMKCVSDYMGQDYYETLKKTRKRELVTCRQISMYLIRNNTELSFSDIGSYVGGKDHTTVLYACKTVEDICATDMKYKRNIDILKSKTLKYFKGYPHFGASDFIRIKKSMINKPIHQKINFNIHNAANR